MLNSISFGLSIFKTLYNCGGNRTAIPGVRARNISGQQIEQRVAYLAKQ